jgi:hypothetical protein
MVLTGKSWRFPVPLLLVIPFKTANET